MMRKTIRLLMDHAAAHSAEPATNNTSEVTHTGLAPNRSIAQPVTGIATPTASRYPVTTHWTVDSGAPSSRLSVSSATFTIVVSSNTMMAPAITTRPVMMTLRSSFPGTTAGAADRVGTLMIPPCLVPIWVTTTGRGGAVPFRTAAAGCAQDGTAKITVVVRGWAV